MSNVDLTSCDREVIHLTPAVQSHGTLLAFNLKELRLEIHSENAPAMLRLPTSELAGARLSHLFDAEVTEHVEDLLNRKALSGPGRHLSLRPRVGGLSFDAFAYLSDGLIVIELEPFAARDFIESDIHNEQVLRTYMRAAKECVDVAQLSRLVCQTIRRITGLDRVMMYRFIAPDMYGEVIAEDPCC